MILLMLLEAGIPLASVMGMEMVNNYFTNQRMGAAVGNNLLTIAKLGHRAAPVNKDNLFKPFIGF